MSFILRQTVVRLTTAALFTVIACLAASPAMAALDLTGTWHGTWSCKDVHGGAQTKPGGTLTMTVSQTGGNANALLAWSDPDDVLIGTGTFQGHVQELTAKPGEGASTLIACGTRPGSYNYAEALSANAKVTSSKATFKGISTYEGAGPTVTGGTCKYSLKRTATADPSVAACPATCPVVADNCGNAVIDAGEQCDQGNLNGANCYSLGLSETGLKCGAGCQFDTSACGPFDPCAPPNNSAEGVCQGSGAPACIACMGADYCYQARVNGCLPFDGLTSFCAITIDDATQCRESCCALP